MHRLHYSGGTLLVADEVCRALLAYARALAGEGSADTVTVPVVDDDGVVRQADLLIGPSSQLYAIEVPNIPAAGDDPDVVNDIDARASRLQPSRPVPEQGAPWHTVTHPTEDI